ncbi:MAG: hypothetical protein RLY86_2234 [Pseudomonadota bacterium]|jgi:FkbM family methyltransferase
MLDCTSAYGLTFWFPAGDRAVGQSLRDAGEFSRVELEFIVETLGLDPAGVVIDVGANLGSVCLPIAARFPSLRVLAFEPNLPIHGLLAANATGNRLTNVEVFPWAVGAAFSVVNFPAMGLGADANFGAVGLDTVTAGTVPVLMVPLDRLGLTGVGLIKIDVEGFDLDVLMGARDLLAGQRPTVVFEGKPGPNTTQAVTLMRDLGYRCYWLYVPFVTARNAKRSPVHLNAWRGDMNIVAVPADRTPVWSLPEIGAADEDWRGRIAEMSYLDRYRR